MQSQQFASLYPCNDFWVQLTIERFQHASKLMQFVNSAILVHSCSPCTRMVLCMVIGCSNCSDGDKHVSYHCLPTVSDHQGIEDIKLRKQRRDGYLAAVSRYDINYDSLDEYRVCSWHFKSGKPAALYDTTNPDWLPTIHMGHKKGKPIDTER